MIIQPIDDFLIVWFTLAALSTIYVAVDQFHNNPEPTVMRWGFILVTLYMGPIGLLLYVLADKDHAPVNMSPLPPHSGSRALAVPFIAWRAMRPASYSQP